ncbi:MAG: hypothetical protein LAQ69_23665 [Acidobacteriia bacterium]|nr:hypothetical protein [Terriglobia bacterium]
MRFAIFKGENSIIDLVSRIFGTLGAGSQTSADHAAAVLLKANPHLADLSNVPVGSLVAIPDTAPPISSGQHAVASGGVRSVLAQTAQSAFEAMHQRLTDIDTAAAAFLKSATDRVQTADFKTALEGLSDQHFDVVGQIPNLDDIAKHTEAATNDLQSGQDLRKQSVTQLQTALSSFAKQ